MRIFEIITEPKILEITNRDQKKKYIDQVWDILDLSYQYVGGFKSYDSPEHMINDDNSKWLVSLNDQNQVLVVFVFKNSFGNKFVAMGGLKSSEARNTLKVMLKDIFNRKTAWGEVSGIPEKMFKDMGVPYISNTEAERLTGKNILELDTDGIHYIRYIGGSPTKKALMGYAKG